MEARRRGGDGSDGARRTGGRAAVIATLAVGLLALAGGIAATLSHAGVRPESTNDAVIKTLLGTLKGAHRVCQGDELIPAGTTAIRVSAVHDGTPAPMMAAAVLREPTLTTIAAGSAPSSLSEATIVPVHPAVARETAGRVCLRFRTHGQAAAISFYGVSAEEALGAADGGAPLGGRVRFEYLRSGAESWWSFAPTVVERIGRGHAWSGSSVALVAGLLTLLSISLAAWLLVRTD